MIELRWLRRTVAQRFRSGQKPSIELDPVLQYRVECRVGDTMKWSDWYDVSTVLEYSELVEQGSEK